MDAALPVIRADRWLTVTLVIAIHIAVGYSFRQTTRQAVTPAVSTQPLLVELLAPRPAKLEAAAPVQPAPPPPEKIEPIATPEPAATPQPAAHETPRPKPRKRHVKHHAKPIRKPVPKPAPVPTRAARPQPVEQPSTAAPTATAPAAAPAVKRQPVNYNADYLRNPAPVYPVLARRLGHTGKVLLHVFVNGDGSPGKVEIKKSSGYRHLDQSALDAVRKWRFVPAREGDHAIASWVTIPIIFKLQG